MQVFLINFTDYKNNTELMYSANRKEKLGAYSIKELSDKGIAWY